MTCIGNAFDVQYMYIILCIPQSNVIYFRDIKKIHQILWCAVEGKGALVMICLHFRYIIFMQYMTKTKHLITKNQKPLKSGTNSKLIFASVPKSPLQIGSLSVKIASSKFSCLGTFKGTVS
jgi:hypothetical protein